MGRATAQPPPTAVLGYSLVTQVTAGSRSTMTPTHCNCPQQKEIPMAPTSHRLLRVLFFSTSTLDSCSHRPAEEMLPFKTTAAPVNEISSHGPNQGPLTMKSLFSHTCHCCRRKPTRLSPLPGFTSPYSRFQTFGFPAGQENAVTNSEMPNFRKASR